MKTGSLLIAATLVLPFLAPFASPALADTPVLKGNPNGGGDSLNGLTQSQLQEAFRALSRHYIDKSSLGYDELNKAALEGLLARLSFGATIVPRNGDDPTETDAPENALIFYHELLPDGVGYLRPVTFSPGEIEQARAALDEFRAGDAQWLVLDLRAPVPQDEYARAAAFLDLFTGANELLFKIAKSGGERPQLFFSKQPRHWDGEVVLVIDPECSPVAETVAAVLNSIADDRIVVGEATDGRTVQFQDIVLTEDLVLRFAAAQVLLPDDAPLFRHGVKPSVVAVTTPKDKQNVFRLSPEKGLARFVVDRERPRFNEAALVSGDNPELDYQVAKTAGRTSPFDRRALQDRALQQALEMLQAITFFQLDEAPAPKPDHAPEPAPDPSAEDSETPEPETN